MKKIFFILLCIAFNIFILYCMGKIYREMMYWVQDLRFKYWIPYLMSDLLGTQILFPFYLFVIVPLSPFFIKKIKQIGIKKYWLINFVLQYAVIVICELYKGIFSYTIWPYHANFYDILSGQFVPSWDSFIVTFFTFSMIVVGIYYNQLLWDKIFLRNNKKMNLQ